MNTVEPTIRVELSNTDGTDVALQPSLVPAIANAIESVLRDVASLDSSYAGVAFTLRLSGMAQGAIAFRLAATGPDIPVEATPIANLVVAIGTKLGYLQHGDGAAKAASDATVDIIALATANADVLRSMEQLVFVVDGAHADHVFIAFDDAFRCKVTDLSIDPTLLIGSRAVVLATDIEGPFNGPIQLTGEMLTGAIQFPRGEPSEVRDMAVGTLYTEVGIEVTALVVWGSTRPAPAEGEAASRHVTGMMRPLRLATPVPHSAVGARAREVQVVLFVQGETTTE